MLIEPKLQPKSTVIDGADAILDAAIDRLLPDDLDASKRKSAVQTLWADYEAAESIERIGRDVDFLKNEIWLPFERRAKVLDHFGYLDFAHEKVTARGKWLADLRVDRPLHVGEALERGIFHELDSKHLAGIMAALAADPDRNYGDLYLSDTLLGVISELEDVIYDVSNVEWKFGIEPAEEINLSAAAAAERWTDGMKWEDLVSRTKAEEGDLVRLLSRTGEALLQVAHLKDAKPGAAAIAYSTAEIVLREPVR
jgi:superfamily II RNA helicase